MNGVFDPVATIVAADVAGDLGRTVEHAHGRFARSEGQRFLRKGVRYGIVVCIETHVGRLAYAVIAAVAELEREIIRERTRCGLEAARRRGAKIGRPRVRVDLDEARRLLDSGLSARKIARKLGCGASTLARAFSAGAVGAPEPSPAEADDAC